MTFYFSGLQNIRHQNACQHCEGPTQCLHTAPLIPEGSIVSHFPAKEPGVEVADMRWLTEGHCQRVAELQGSDDPSLVLRDLNTPL